MNTAMHFLTFLAPFLALGVQLGLSPEIKPLWATLKQPWPRVIGAALSVVGTTLSAHASGDDWNTALMKGAMGLTATGLVGHSLTKTEPTPPAAAPPVAS